jgi:hypothetical protein
MFGFRKGGLIVVHPLKIYQNTKLYGPMLIGACFFIRPPFCNGCIYGIKSYGGGSPSMARPPY